MAVAAEPLAWWDFPTAGETVKPRLFVMVERGGTRVYHGIVFRFESNISVEMMCVRVLIATDACFSSWSYGIGSMNLLKT